MVTRTATSRTNCTIPALEPGDHLTAEEFERRYEAMPEVKKAELIEGIVFMPSPVRLHQHGSPNAIFIWWLTHYWAFTPGVRVGDNTTIRLNVKNQPQPDALMIREPSHGGRVVIGPHGYIESAPDLVGEIAASTASFDLHAKLDLYRRNEVQEYIVWRVEEAELDWFVLRANEYVRLPLSCGGIYQSESFPGLWLDPLALVGTDLPAILHVLQQGIASPEHASYLSRLQQAFVQAKES